MYIIKKTIPYQNIIKKSKFIALLQYVETKEEIEAFLNEVKKNYPNATHYVYAYRLSTIEKAFDDGEPAKTAGLPILNVLKNKEITNVICVIVRYFGGIKLGANGLIRAYTSAVVEALEKSTLSPLIPSLEVTLTVSYEDWNYLKKRKEFENIIEIQYLENIEVRINMEKEKWERIFPTLKPILKKYTIEKETFL